MVWVPNVGKSQLAGNITHSLKKSTSLHVDSSSASVYHGISLLLAVPHLLVLPQFYLYFCSASWDLYAVVLGRYPWA